VFFLVRKGNKRQKQQTGLHQTKKLLGNGQWSEKKTYGVREEAFSSY
jgi:hypothetical protein